MPPPPPARLPPLAIDILRNVYQTRERVFHGISKHREVG